MRCVILVVTIAMGVLSVTSAEAGRGKRGKARHSRSGKRPRGQSRATTNPEGHAV